MCSSETCATRVCARPPGQPGRLIARDPRGTRPAYSPKVLYSAGRPTEVELPEVSAQCGPPFTIKIGAASELYAPPLTLSIGIAKLDIQPCRLRPATICLATEPSQSDTEECGFDAPTVTA